MLNELSKTIHENAKNHGFYEDSNINIPEKLMLIVSELGEAMEAYRKDHFNNIDDYDFISDAEFEQDIKDCFEDELADSVIRILDLCAFMHINIDAHIKYKMKYNESRPYKHGKKC